MNWESLLGQVPIVAMFAWVMFEMWKRFQVSQDARDQAYRDSLDQRDTEYRSSLEKRDAAYLQMLDKMTCTINAHTGWVKEKITQIETVTGLMEPMKRRKRASASKEGDE